VLDAPDAWSKPEARTMKDTREVGDWRILHGEWRDGGASLTIVATRQPARRGWRPNVTKLSRLLCDAGALLLIALYIVPLWTIRLFAPQYPEGLGMRIHLSSRRPADRG
jgi:hypothetical protein